MQRPLAERSFLNTEQSLYLDLVRFVAALLVLIYHGIRDQLYQSHILGGLGHEAVVVFFVLSGLVIAITSSRPQETGRSYAVARIARVYSVALPAVILTVLAVLAATALGLGAGDPEIEGVSLLRSVVTSLLFLNESWINGGMPWNSPYWSLCYEVWYYVIFGIAFFYKGAARWWLVLAAALVAGPAVLALAPVWLIGAWIAFDRRLRITSPAVGLAVVIVTWVLVVALKLSGLPKLIQSTLWANVPGWWRLDSSQLLVTDYVTGLLVAANFIGFRACSHWFARPLARLAPAIRFGASCTFSIYLFHRPIMEFITAAGVRNVEGPLASSLVLLLIVSLCCGLALVTEQRREEARRAAAWLVDRFMRRPQQPVIDLAE